MKIAYRFCIVSLVLLSVALASFAQDGPYRRPEKDSRNTAPTVGTGGPVGGPTGLFTVYDGSTLLTGEYTFSAAYSNYDRDPGNVDLTEVPVSFQVGLSNNFEVFFTTDAYKAIKVNSPRNLSSFYLPNSQVRVGGMFQSGPAVIMAPVGSGLGNQAVFRPTGTAPFTPYPYVGGTATTAVPGTIGSSAGGNGAANFPGVGSIYGSVLPGVVLQTTANPNALGGQVPTSFTTAPTYLPDAPFINREWAESSFNSYVVGAKWRMTSVSNPVGIGLTGFYRFYQDRLNTISNMNMVQRGASSGSSRGDFGLTAFADVRATKWMNVSANIGYVNNGDVEGDLGGGNAVLLDRPDELQAAIGFDFPVNKYFQPIVELRSLHYVGGRTPNAFENNPIDAIAGFRVFPARWFGFGLGYRYNINQQSSGSFDDEESFTTAVTVPTVGAAPVTIVNNFRGVPPGFATSTDPHGYIVQAFIGRRDVRATELIDQPANVTALDLSDTTVTLGCQDGFKSRSGACSDSRSIDVKTTAVDPENAPLEYVYTVTGGSINGSGANVAWDLSNAQPGTYTITAAVNDGCGVCGQTQTKTITIAECDDCEPINPCDCATLSVTGPAGVTQPGGTMSFTANVSGGNYTPTYNWSVSDGTIIEGQGTANITVQVPAEGVSNITATVELGGVPADCNCPTSASETGPVTPDPKAEQTDEFDALSNDDIRGRLDNFFITLQNNPTDRGYIINYGTARQIAARERLIQNHIRFRRFDASRITMVRGEGDIKTKLYRVPSGAEDPMP